MEAPTVPPKTNLRGLWLFLAGATIAWLASAFVLRVLVPNLESRGVFGDSFGAVNALFSGLALAGVVYAILQQNEARDQQLEALRLQRQALAMQLDELRVQQQALAAQIDEMKQQRAEMETQSRALRDQGQAMLIGAALAAASQRQQSLQAETLRGPYQNQKPGVRERVDRQLAETTVALEDLFILSAKSLEVSPARLRTWGIQVVPSPGEHQLPDALSGVVPPRSG